MASELDALVQLAHGLNSLISAANPGQVMQRGLLSLTHQPSMSYAQTKALLAREEAANEKRARTRSHGKSKGYTE
jgi:hypothetical protein